MIERNSGWLRLAPIDVNIPGICGRIHHEVGAVGRQRDQIPLAESGLARVRESVLPLYDDRPGLSSSASQPPRLRGALHAFDQ